MEPLPRTIVALTRRERELIRERLLVWFAETGHTYRYLAARLNCSLGTVGKFCSTGRAGDEFLAALLRDNPSLAEGIAVTIVGRR